MVIMFIMVLRFTSENMHGFSETNLESDTLLSHFDPFWACDLK